MRRPRFKPFKMQETNNTSKLKVFATDYPLVDPPALDGITIMRYAQGYRERSSGGVEQYLRHLDRELLQKHRLTVIQMYLSREDANDAIEVENVGLGQILWVPVVTRQTVSRLADFRVDCVAFIVKHSSCADKREKGASGPCIGRCGIFCGTVEDI